MKDKEYMQLIGKIFATGIMSFCGVVSETAMNVTFPTLMKEFDINTDSVQWVTTGYLLILSLTITLSPYLKHNYSQRTLFLTAITCFIFATTLCWLSPAFWTLIVGRMLQGVGSGIALPLMFNIILAEAPKEKLGMFMGVGSLITAMAPAVGPVLGGFIVDQWGWREIFLVLLCLLIPALVLGAWLIKDSEPEGHLRLHIFDYVLLVIAYSSFIFATTSAARAGWLSWRVIPLFILSFISILFYAYKSGKEQAPLLQFKAVLHQKFLFGLLSILAVQFATLAMGYIIPNYSQIVNHTSAFLAGGLLVPGCLVGAVLAVYAGVIYDRLGPCRPILTGNTLLVMSLLLFSLFGRGLTTPIFFGFYIIYTLGQGLCVGNTMTYCLSQLPPGLSADGNALINSLQQLSGAAGTAVATTIVSSRQSADPLNFAAATGTGTVRTLWVLLVILILAAFCAVRMLSGKPLQHSPIQH